MDVKQEEHAKQNPPKQQAVSIGRHLSSLRHTMNFCRCPQRLRYLPNTLPQTNRTCLRPKYQISARVDIASMALDVLIADTLVAHESWIVGLPTRAAHPGQHDQYC